MDGEPNRTTRVREGAPGERPLSVVQLCAPARVGGLERVVQGLSRGLAEAGHQVSVVAVTVPGSELDEFLDPLDQGGIPVHRVEIAGRRYLRESRKVGELLARIRPDVLHTHGYRSDILHGLLAGRRGIATVSTLHGSSRMGGLSHLFEWIQERALGRFDGVIAVSEPLRDRLLECGVPSERLHFVPNAWVPPERYLTSEEARSELGLPAEPILIGWIGRLIPIKGCDVFLDALAELGGNEWHAVVVGDGPVQEELERRAARLDLAGRVSFVGSIPEAARIVRAFDLFVLSSRSEGTPMTVMEAMGAGVPVVASAVGGVPQVVVPPEVGWLVPPEDPSALAGAMREALDRPDERRDRGGRGSATIHAKYTPELWVARHVGVYRSAIGVNEQRV